MSPLLTVLLVIYAGTCLVAWRSFGGAIAWTSQGGWPTGPGLDAVDLILGVILGAAAAPVWPVILLLLFIARVVPRVPALKVGAEARAEARRLEKLVKEYEESER